MCVVGVGSDVFESARFDASGRLLAIRVGSPFCAHFSSSDRVGSVYFESARMAYHIFVRTGRVGSWTLGSARVIIVLNFLRRAMIESARLLLESARVHKFRKLELQLD